MNLSIYATKNDLKGAAGIDSSILASKTDLASLKTKVDNLDVDKLRSYHVDLPKLSNMVDNTALNPKAIEIENKVPDINNLATKAALNTKAVENESKILATKASLNRNQNA